MDELLLRGGDVLTPDGVRRLDVRVAEGRVAEVGERLGGSGAEELDAAGAWVGPGLVDLHVHVREPGEEWKEDVASVSGAAAAGGFTAIVAMPNTVPPIDAGHLARYLVDRGRGVGLVELAPAGCLTEGRAGGRLAHLDELWAAGVRMFTDDGDAVADAGLLRRAMEYLAELGGVVAEHAEDRGLSGDGQMHEGEVSSRLGMAGIPAEAEEVVVARDLALVRMTGVRYHVQHVSTAGTVALVRQAKRDGLPVTAEVTPHHLTFDHRAVAGTDPRFKMYPPLREPRDMAALRRALADGTVDAVATDHAPHASYETEVPFEEAPRGVIGLETAAAAVLATGADPPTFFERLSIAPAVIAGLEHQGRPVEPGSPGSLVVFDPEARWQAGPFVSRSENSPFRGAELRGRARYTLHRGILSWAEGKVRW